MTKYGPQTSTWIREKDSTHKLLWEGKDNFFCLAKGQIVQTLDNLSEKDGNTSLKGNSLLKEGCPNLKCHKVDISLSKAEVEKADLKALLVER